MEDGFRIVVDPHISFQPLPHPSVAVGMKAFDLLLPDCLGKGSILFRMLHPLYKAVIAASGHCKELAHDEYWILFSMTVNHRVLCLRAHFLSVDRRKSRSSLFSMRSYRISLACSAAISLGKASFLGRPLGRERIPDSCFRFFLRSRASKCFTTYLLKIYNMTLLPAAPSPLPA